MTVTGQWENVFGSVVWLWQDSRGSVAGVYSSTTGSSGAYWVIGFADPEPPSDGEGQSLAFSIFWRSIEGGPGDPSWHYVSGFSGQLIMLNNTPTLSMIHDMVATTPFPKVVPAVGSYLDKLLYTPADNPRPAPHQWPAAMQPPTVSSPIDGTWAAVDDDATVLRLAVQDATFGYVTGTLETADGVFPVAGFTDTYAGADGLALQGLTLSALVSGRNRTVGLAGSLEIGRNVLSLSSLASDGTAAASTWIQTRLQSLQLTRQPAPRSET